MREKKRTDDRLAEARTRLYSVPLEAFVATRKSVAAELRAEGARDEAVELLKSKKPSRSAWALNHVAHTTPEVIASFLEATRQVKEAQKAAVKRGDAAALREAGRALTASIADVIARVRRALGGRETDMQATASVERAIARSLRTVPFATPEEIENLTRGTLIVDIDAPSDFGVFGDIPLSRESKVPAPEPPPKKGNARDAQREKGEAAKRRTERMEREAREKANRAAAARARQLAERADKLELAAKKAEEAATQVEREAAEAARHAEHLQARAHRARDAADAASTEATDARANASAAKHANHPHHESPVGSNR